MYVLIDCDHFYVSCERVFNPKLNGQPVVILSNNDGSIVDRSNEAKALGIPMGAPYFQWRDFLKRHHVAVLSSNYALYGDLSFQVMRTLETFNPDCEIYSIDEIFLTLSENDDPIAFGRFLKEKIKRWTGIPVSIGIAPTKTLAKVANRQAKKLYSLDGVCAFLSSEQIEKNLETLPTEDIWGIGRRFSNFLQKKGIYTAAQFKNQDDHWIRNALSTKALRTAWELRGIPSLEFDEMRPNKHSIVISRSFEHPIIKLETLEEIISTYAARETEKLRQAKRLASSLQVFLMTSFHKPREPFYANALHLTFSEPTAYTPTVVAYAKMGLQKIFREGYFYKKGGVIVTAPPLNNTMCYTETPD
ncbi:MAG: Y-family DNA polymerase [Chlamydiia bacterium]|nr:Y-family DNA polymerase [Chlamydiia bacterium]